MNPMTTKEGIELEIQIEELEAKIAPDGGETVLPLPCHGHGCREEITFSLWERAKWERARSASAIARRLREGKSSRKNEGAGLIDCCTLILPSSRQRGAVA